MTGRLVSHCVCCLTVAPAEESSEFDDWEAFRSDGGLLLVCPDCITPVEQHAIDEQMGDK